MWSNIWSLATAKMASEFASDLGDTWAGSGLLISMLEKFKIKKNSLDWSNKTGAIDVKMDGSGFEKITFWDGGVDFLF